MIMHIPCQIICVLLFAKSNCLTLEYEEKLFLPYLSICRESLDSQDNICMYPVKTETHYSGTFKKSNLKVNEK